MSLREVKYRCPACTETNDFKFEKDYKPFRKWWVRCAHCLKHTLQQCLSRGALTSPNFR